ncbi:unnamed protein product [Orchesella dallaii]|uniref:Uncharacterized protein n=1 Tax=Orchesella dallaii TaxID=48710 RepID=A0ABP1RMS9_9HEXA
MDIENIPPALNSSALTEIMDEGINENVDEVEPELAVNERVRNSNQGEYRIPQAEHIIALKQLKKAKDTIINRKNKKISKLIRKVNQLKALLLEHGIVENHHDTEGEREPRPPIVLVDLEAEPEPPSPPEDEVLPQVIRPIPPAHTNPVVSLSRLENVIRIVGPCVPPHPAVEARPLTRRRSMRIAEYTRLHPATTTITAPSCPPPETVTDPRRRGRPTSRTPGTSRTTGTSRRNQMNATCIAGRTRSRFLLQMKLRKRN